MRFRRNIEIEFQQDRKYSVFQLNNTPFISSIDLIGECITLTNPKNSSFELKDYFVTDGKKMHIFKFPEDCVILPSSTLNIYTCPGKVEDHDTFIEPYVLWTNHDGSLRKKEVLNNEQSTMQLHDPAGKCLASCTAVHEGNKLSVRRRNEEVLFLPAIRFGMNSQLIIGYLRIISVFAMLAAAVYDQASMFIGVFWLSFFLDIIGRGDNTGLEGEAAKLKHRIDSIHILGDRLHSLVLYGAVLQQFFLLQIRTTATNSGGDGTSGQIGTMLSAHAYLNLPVSGLLSAALLDFCANVWSSHHNHIQALQSLSYSKLHDFYERIHDRSPELLTLVTIGSEYFLLFLYTQINSTPAEDAFSVRGVNSLNDVVSYIYIAVAYLAAVSFALKQVQSVSQLLVTEQSNSHHNSHSMHLRSQH